jgi:hypothetical protein
MEIHILGRNVIGVALNSICLVLVSIELLCNYDSFFLLGL